MKVKDLIEKLKEHDPEAMVALSKDAEGNGYSPLADIEAAGYSKDDHFSGLTYNKLTPELEKMGFSEEDIDEDAEDCVFLWPLN